MPSAFIDVPLGLDLEFPGYETCHLEFSNFPCQPLVHDLVRALFERTNTGGPIKTPVTAKSYRKVIAHAVRWFHAQGFEGGARDLSEDMVFDFWRACSADKETIVRTLLRDIEQRSPGRLIPGVVRQLGGVSLNRQPVSRPRRPYSAGETRRLVEACTATIEAAEAAMAEAADLAAGGADPADAGWKDRANLAWLLDRHGPHTVAALAERVGGHRRVVAVSATLSGLHEVLYPTNDAALAFRVLLGLQTGICPEGVDALQADCVEWIGAGEARISWFKARGGGRQNQVFASRGPWSPGRLIERWLAFSGRARCFAPDPSALWLFSDGAHLRIHKPGFWPEIRDAFVARHQLLCDDGTPLPIRFGMLRATYFARHDRAWNGALRIDTNHSSAVEGDHYLAQTRAIEPIEATIEAAQRDALRRASTAVLTVLTRDALAELQADPVVAADRLEMTKAASAQLLAGERDVFASACKDFYNSPHGNPGEPCPVPVWTCLCCPLAVFTPSKLPNLLRLRDHLARQWQSLPATEWMAMYGPANVRLERDILPKFGAAVIEAAREVTAEDRDGAVYLRPEEHATWPA